MCCTDRLYYAGQSALSFLQRLGVATRKSSLVHHPVANLLGAPNAVHLDDGIRGSVWAPALDTFARNSCQYETRSIRQFRSDNSDSSCAGRALQQDSLLRNQTRGRPQDSCASGYNVRSRKMIIRSRDQWLQCSRSHKCRHTDDKFGLELRTSEGVIKFLL